MKYIIVGAVAGGASTAARLRRMDEQAEIVLFEKGAYISYANCGLPYYIGEVIKDRNKLFVQTAAAFKTRFKVDVRVRTEVLSIDRAGKTITARNGETGVVYTERYDKLVLSPGA
ncbi:MAG TPA: FAD-dependent oxidoreductase, partial [Bacteroidia bacterium]|nr:FAD-dependent oxidoreductase [Bacteroidia bacterium]